jgi:uncharacterized protein (TIGR03437 family)
MKSIVSVIRLLRGGSRACLQVAIVGGLLPPVVEGRVTRIQITSREIIAGGVAFGAAGPYEKLRGAVDFEVDPAESHNAVVFDIDKAPRNSRGRVEFSADIFILKPVDMQKGNGALLVEVPNRGGKTILGFLNDTAPGVNSSNPTTAADIGNGFLLRRGYTIAWVGWSAGLIPGADRLTARFPVAMQDGQPLRGRVLNIYWDAHFGGATPFTLPISGFPIFQGVESISTDPIVAQAELRARSSDSFPASGPEIPEGAVVPSSQWSLARCPNGPPGTASTTDICLAGGFQNNQVYELVYTAANSPVSGLGYVTTRDFVSFLRGATIDDNATLNPLAGISRAVCYGYSISGQYLRDFIYQGFNVDEQGKRVCDGAFIHSAGSQKSALNFRFATDPNASPFRSQHAGRNVPETNFPRAYAIRPDPLTGRMDGILKRTTTDPKVMHVDSSTEYWQRRASLLDTDEDGRVETVDPTNVRRFLISGTQHATTNGALPTFGIGNRQCQQLSGTLHRGALVRSLLVSLDEWVRSGVEPPPSRVPRLSDETLVAPNQSSTGFPAIPGVTFGGLLNGSGERDFGPGVTGNSGNIDNLWAKTLSTHRLLVPKVDAAGNDRAGLRHPFVESPVATLAGWNLRRPEFTAGDLCDANGMTVPLPRTRADRLAIGDARPSLEELYGDQAGYVSKVTTAAQNLKDGGFLLQEDADAVIQAAATVPTLSAIANAAVFTSNMAPGSLVSIFGTGLAGAVLQAPANAPLPAQLFDVSVTFNEMPAPLYYVSPIQINAQVPFEVGPGQVRVQVRRNLAASLAESITVEAAAPSILTVDQRGSGAGLILHAADARLITEASPARPGESVAIYCTGLGPLKTPLRTGAIAPNPPPETVVTPRVTIGGLEATVNSSSAAPGYAGLYRVIVQIPVESPKGNAVTLQITMGGVSSNLVTLAVQ